MEGDAAERLMRFGAKTVLQKPSVDGQGGVPIAHIMSCSWPHPHTLLPLRGLLLADGLPPALLLLLRRSAVPTSAATAYPLTTRSVSRLLRQSVVERHIGQCHRPDAWRVATASAAGRAVALLHVLEYDLPSHNLFNHRVLRSGCTRGAVSSGARHGCLQHRHTHDHRRSVRPTHVGKMRSRRSVCCLAHHV